MAEDGLGGSWDTPLVYLNVALEHFRNNTYDGKKRVIYVKEGTVSPLCAYNNTRYLSASIQMVSGVEVYGGMPVRSKIPTVPCVIRSSTVRSSTVR